MKEKLFPAGLMVVLAFAAQTESAQSKREDGMARQSEERPCNDHYVSNRTPLLASAFIKLPVGAVKPRGWLLEMLRRQRDGLAGNLHHISAWLEREDNAWLSKDGKGKWGWEEVPYWLKGYVSMGIILEDREAMGEALLWIEGALQSQREDGNFGPINRFKDGTQDFWANMIMLFCLQSYYEYSNDQRVLDLMTSYFRYQLSVPDEKFLTGFWPKMRAGDNLYSVYWLYNRTGQAWLLDLAEKIHRNTADWTMERDLPNWHNVNIAQAFGEPGTYYLQSQEEADLKAAYDNFFLIRELYGQVPGGMFGADENARPGFDDPRQAIETCGMVEQMLSDETLFRITGDPFWADHCEEVAFNSLPSAFMPDMKSLRYLTSPNQVTCDKENHAPGFQNRGAMTLMNPLSHRCCQHNHGHGWPYFIENLWMAAPDNGLCAALYGPCQVEATVGEGRRVKLVVDTKYPFEEEIRISFSTEEPVEFPLAFRVPGWCGNPSLTIQGKKAQAKKDSKGFLRVSRVWRGGDQAVLRLPMKVRVRRWEKNHGSVSVDRGPLTYSLDIGERWVKVASNATGLRDSRWQKELDADAWPALEVLPTTPWNYALVLDEKRPEKSFEVAKRDWPSDEFPFTQAASPIALKARGKRIPEWTLDRHGLCAPLQDSPARTEEQEEEIRLVPMGAARLRISAFPVAGEGAKSVPWEPVPKPQRLYEASTSHCFSGDEVQAVADGLEPEDSNDHSIPRHTFWSHKGGVEWIQAEFPEATEVDCVQVYWFDDEVIGGGCRVPKAWRLLYLRDGDWAEVKGVQQYGVAKDRYNEIRFEKVKASTFRLEVHLQDDYSAGVLEWKIESRTPSP